jgi:transcriptional regulator EpsA
VKSALQAKANSHNASRDPFHTAMLAGLAESSPAGSAVSDDFSRVIESSRDISRPSHLLLWLQGELQQFIPHQVLIVAWGHFITEDVRYNVVSLPGSEITQFPHAEISPLLRRLYGRWIDFGRQAFGLKNAEFSTDGLPMAKEKLPKAFSCMRSILVHGVRDVHTGRDRLYITMHSDSAVHPGSSKTLQALMPCIDRVLRRISTLRTHQRDAAGTSLSEREREILDWVRKGKTNLEIGAILGISPFTVKNHLQRIFRKLDVLNRAQAIGKFAGDGQGDGKLGSFLV